MDGTAECIQLMWATLTCTLALPMCLVPPRAGSGCEWNVREMPGQHLTGLPASKLHQHTEGVCVVALISPLSRQSDSEDCSVGAILAVEVIPITVGIPMWILMHNEQA